MISCENIARLVQKGWRLEVVQDGVRADRYHARVIPPRGSDDTSHHHLGDTVLRAIDSLDVYVGVVMPDKASGSES